MAARRTEDLPASPGLPLPLCPEHRRKTCYRCLHSYNCDASGEVGSPYTTYHDSARRPLRGRDALFIPQMDAHLGLSAGVTLRSNLATELNAREDHRIDTMNIITPPPMAPHDDWFVFCPQCQLTWISGHEGPSAAASHPAHTAFRDKRTLVCWVGVRDVVLPSQISHSVETQAGVVYFGPRSKYNSLRLTTGDTQDKLIEAIRHCLTTVRTSVLPGRSEAVDGTLQSNSWEFMEKARKFRLVVVLSHPPLVEFLQSIGSLLIWGRLKDIHNRDIYPMDLYRTRYGAWKPRLGNFKLREHDALRSIEEELDRLASAEIMVSRAN